MQTIILIISIACNVLFIGAIIYLICTEDKRRKKREWRSFVEQMLEEGRRARICAGYHRSVGTDTNEGGLPHTREIIQAWLQAGTKGGC